MSQKTKYLLDTSIQISRCNPSEQKFVDQNLKNAKIYTSYFVRYEFLTGFIKSLIDYYFLVNITESPAIAMGIWSNEFGRATKFKTLLDAELASMAESVVFHPKEAYLRQIEAVIFTFYSIFETDVIYVGDFGSDDIVKTNINSSNDYQSFLDKIKLRPFIPLNEFWSKHLTDLGLITTSLDNSRRKPIIRLNKMLKKIQEDCLEANSNNINRSIGDVVIAVDCPKNLILLTTDSRFELLCPAIDKMHLKLVKHNYRKI